MSSSKNYGKLFTLMASGAVLIGGMAIGCTDKDRDVPAVAKTLLEVIVGVENPVNPVNNKGYDVPAVATQYVLGVYDKDGNLLLDNVTFSADGTNKWEEEKSDEGTARILGIEIDESVASEVATVMVSFIDGDGAVNGVLTSKVTSDADGNYYYDFTGDEAPAFVTYKEVIANSKLENIITEPALENNEVSIKLNETLTVNSVTPVYIDADDNRFASEPIEYKDGEFQVVEDPDYNAVTVEGNVVTGAEAGDENLVVEMSMDVDDEKLAISSEEITVHVTSDEPVVDPTEEPSVEPSVSPSGDAPVEPTV